MLELATFPHAERHAEALAQAVAGALTRVLAGRAPDARACLAVSGGTSPTRFFQALSRCALDWGRVDVTLVDDRWVAPDDAASNARLVTETLLCHAAGAAAFRPLASPDARADAPFAEVEAHVAALNADPSYGLPDVAVLGIGEDGHTGSLFADAPQWPTIRTTDRRFVAVQPTQAPYARVSLSLEALARIAPLFLLIEGPVKYDVLQQAAAAPRDNAISTLLHHQGVTLNAYWCSD